MRQTVISSAAILSAMLLVGASRTPQRPISTADGPVEAITRASQDLQLGFTVPGRVAEVLVRPGDSVQPGQLLIRLDNPDGESQLKLFELRAVSDLEIRAAEAEWKLAEKKSERTAAAHLKEGANLYEVELARLESERSRLALELFRQRKIEAELQLRVAREQNTQFEIVAPTAGVIEEVAFEKGETIEALRPVIRLVAVGTLRIDAAVPTPQTLALQVGADATVRYRLPDQTGEVRGRVVHVAQVADAASDTRLVRVEFENKERLPAGCHVEVSFPAKNTPGEKPGN